MPKRGDDTTSKEDFSLDNYYSLLELLDQIGKEGVAELVAKSKPQRVTRGDMIYFAKQDVNKILGKNLEHGLAEEPETEEPEAEEPAKESAQGDQNFSLLVFKQTLVKRHEVGKEEEVYHDRILDISQEVLFGRSKGHTQDQSAFKGSGVISSLHGKLYLDEDHNLLYENLGANKSKIRGCKDQAYAVLGKDEVGVLIASSALQEVIRTTQPLTASIKLGYQLKPHFIIRISVFHKAHQHQVPKINLADDN